MVIEPLHSCEDLINLLQVWFGLFRYFTHLLSKVQCGLLQVIPGLFNIGHSLNTVFRDLLYSLPTIIEMINFIFSSSYFLHVGTGFGCVIQVFLLGFTQCKEVLASIKKRLCLIKVIDNIKVITVVLVVLFDDFRLLFNLVTKVACEGLDILPFLKCLFGSF